MTILIVLLVLVLVGVLLSFAQIVARQNALIEEALAEASGAIFEIAQFRKLKPDA